MADQWMRASIALAFLLLAASLAVTPVSNNDVWLHLKTGSLILERLEVPRVEEYTFTREGAPIVDHEWLAQVLFALAHSAGGIPALILVKLLLTVAVIGLVYAAVARRVSEAGSALGAPEAPGAQREEVPREEPGVEPDRSGRLPPIAVAVTGLAAILVGTHLFVRPHLFTFVLAAAYLVLLPGAGGSEPQAWRRSWLLLAGLQVLWANLHGGFVIGILLAAIFAVGQALDRRKITGAMT
jgi:hypothetical protein